MSWMSEEIIAGLRVQMGELMTTVRESDDAATEARQHAAAYEQTATDCDQNAKRARHQLDQLRILAAIAEGKAPLPGRDEIQPTEDGLGLTLGALRIAGLPDDPTPEDCEHLADIMRSFYAAISSVAHKAEERGRALLAEREPQPVAGVEVPEDGQTINTPQAGPTAVGELVAGRRPLDDLAEVEPVDEELLVRTLTDMTVVEAGDAR